MEFIAQTETSSLNTANIAGLLNTSENKTAGKGDSAFADVFAAQIHENKPEATVNVQGISETTADAGNPFDNTSLDSMPEQNVIIKDSQAFFSQDADDSNQRTMNVSVSSDPSVKLAAATALFKQAIDASTDHDPEWIKESIAAFFQGNAPEATEKNLNDLAFVTDENINAVLGNSSFSNNDKAIVIENKIEQLQDLMAAFLGAVKAETTPSNDSQINAENLTIASSDETANSLTALTQQTSVNNKGNAMVIENKIDLLKNIMAAFLYSVQTEAPASNTETIHTDNLMAASSDKATTSSTFIAQQASANNNGQTIENKIDLLKDILAAFLEAAQSETPASNSETINADNLMTSSGDETATSSTSIAQQASTNNNGQTIENKIDLLKDILAAFLQESERQASAVNPINGNIATVNKDDTAASAIGNAGETNNGKTIEQKGETGRAAFMNRVTELLNVKGKDGASITEMISRIQTLAGTVQKKAAVDAETSETVFSASEKISTKTASAGNKMDASPSVNLTDAAKQETVKSSTFPFAPGQDGMMTNSTRQDGQPSVQSASKIKIHEQLDMPDQKTSTVNSSTFSDITASEAKTSPGIKMQALIDQISQAKQQMNSDYGRVKITLNPPDLGTVDMEVIVRQNKVAVTLTADHTSVQQLLQAHSEEVKSALQRQDMKIDVFQVFLQNNNNGSQQQSNPWASMQGQGGQESAYFENHEESADQSSTVPSRPAPSSQGLVSIFV